MVTIAAAQFGASADKAANLERMRRLAETARDRGAAITCFPELCTTPYFCWESNPAHFSLAEPIPGPSTTVLSRVAAEQGVVVVASLFEKRAEGLFHNTAVVIDADGALLGKYRKMHIPDGTLY